MEQANASRKGNRRLSWRDLALRASPLRLHRPLAASLTPKPVLYCFLRPPATETKLLKKDG